MTTPNQPGHDPQWEQQPSGQRSPQGESQWTPPTGAQPTQQWQPPADPQPQQWQPPQASGWGQPGQPGQQGQPGGSHQPSQPWNQPTSGQPHWNQPSGGQPGTDQAQWNQPPQQWNAPTGAQPMQQWNQPGSDQPGSDQAQWNQPAGGQPTQQWNQPGQGQVPPPGYGTPGAVAYGEPPKKKNKGILITAVAVVVALVAGLGVYFLAIRNNDPAGQASPQAAAAKLFSDVDNGDLIGLTDTLDPVEAQFATDLAGDVITQFKRLGLLNDSATVNNSTGANISIKGITFDTAAEEKPLSNLTIVKLTGGTITVNPTADNSAIQTDLYKSLVDAVKNFAAKQGGAAGSSFDQAMKPTTIDIAQVIKDDNKGKPIRISTVERDGTWYPSLLYTAADYWAQSEGLGAVTAADAIEGKGKSSPEDAVNAMIQAIIDQKATDVIQLLPPDELSAVHAYGKKIADAIGTGSPADVTFKAQWNINDTTGGKLLSVKSLEFTADGETGTVEIDQAAGSITITAEGKTQTFDADSISELIGSGKLEEIHPDMPDFVQRMLKAALGIGVVATQVDGSWYVSPLRTYSGLFTTLLGGMEQKDIQMFIDLLNK